MKKRVQTSSDRISDLPDHIRQYILSLLDIRDAVRTSVLSRRWRHEWNWLPCLTFKSEVLPRDLRLEDTSLISSLSKGWQQENFQKRVAFLDFLGSTLVRRSSKVPSNVLQELYLFVPATSVELVSGVELASRIDLWLGCAVKCDVRKLKLHVSPKGNDFRYYLPESILKACSLTWLKLSNCGIISRYPTIIKLTSLRKMSLSLVFVDEQTLHSMIASCPALRKLSLLYCSGFENLEISGAPQLDEVSVYASDELERVAIDTLHLRGFSIEGSSLTSKMDVAACQNIQRLILKEVNITDHQLSFHLAQLHLLEHLELVNCDLLKRVKISALCLNHLTVEDCKELVKAEIDAPNLGSFTYQARSILSLSLKVSSLARAVVNLSYHRTDVRWYARLIEFLEEFNHSIHLTLFIAPDRSVLIPEDLRRSFDPPLFYVKHVKVQVGYLPNEHSLAELVDSILWLSPHPDSITVSFILDFGSNDIQFHFVYQELVDSEGSHSCCSSFPIKCWRHCLKEVKINNLTDLKESANLKVLFENAERLETIEGLPLKHTCSVAKAGPSFVVMS